VWEDLQPLGKAFGLPERDEESGKGGERGHTWGGFRSRPRHTWLLKRPPQREESATVASQGGEEVILLKKPPQREQSTGGGEEENRVERKGV